VCSPHSHLLKGLPKALFPGWSDRDMKSTDRFPLVSSLRMIFHCPCDDGLHSVDHFGVFTSPRTHSAPIINVSRWMLFTETVCVISKNHIKHTEVRVYSEAIPCNIFGRKKCQWNRSFSKHFGLPCQYYFTNAPYSYFHIADARYSRQPTLSLNNTPPTWCRV
jgi:hypothetical protein